MFIQRFYISKRGLMFVWISVYLFYNHKLTQNVTFGIRVTEAKYLPHIV